MALCSGFRAEIGTIFQAEIILLNCHPGLGLGARPLRRVAPLLRGAPRLALRDLALQVRQVGLLFLKSSRVGEYLTEVSSILNTLPACA